jgi:hypothetical protein
MIFAGDRYRVEIKNPLQPFKQTFDGTRTISSVENGFTLPPFNRLGFQFLTGSMSRDSRLHPSVTGNQKSVDFGLPRPRGFYTDFYLDEKTNQIKGYDSSYQINGRDVKTAVEIDKLRLVDGVLVPRNMCKDLILEVDDLRHVQRKADTGKYACGGRRFLDR